MKVRRFDHITVAVNDLDAAIETFTRCFNLQAKDRRRVEHLGMENVFLPFGDGAIELAAPLKDADAADHVQRFLERRGEGMMNLCLTVEDVDAAITHLKKCGVRVIEHKDADGDNIAMIHPKDMHGAMIEIRRGKRLIRDA
ncbi:MAG: VOC family protein [Deltaproteobacteria bacterium]|jgi:methylmalonyl-CoA/ethylmalonyl-CoA epimerase|nr:VOC family protein [Deltaproteobacteria bacterium]